MQLYFKFIRDLQNNHVVEINDAFSIDYLLIKVSDKNHYSISPLADITINYKRSGSFLVKIRIGRLSVHLLIYISEAY